MIRLASSTFGSVIDGCRVTRNNASVEVTDQAQALHRRSIVIDGCSFFLRYNDHAPSGRTDGDQLHGPRRVRRHRRRLRGRSRLLRVVRRDPRSSSRTVADIERCKGDSAAILGAQNSLPRHGLVLVEMFHSSACASLTPTSATLRATAGWSRSMRPVSFRARSHQRSRALRHRARPEPHRAAHDHGAIEASEQPVVVTHAGIRRFVTKHGDRRADEGDRHRRCRRRDLVRRLQLAAA